MTELPKTITRSSIDSTLRSAGINCLYAETAKEVIELLSSLNAMTKFAEYQIVLVNIVLFPSQNLDKIIESCESVSLPLLVIVSQDEVSLIEPHLGIADFITYLINNQELITRVRKAVFNSRKLSDDIVITRGNLTINPTSYEVVVSNTKINLRFKEYELLLLLASNPGRVYDRATLLNQIWGYDYFGGTRTVDVHIGRLRSKIEHDPDNPFIETIWNVGYRFRTEENLA